MTTTFQKFSTHNVGNYSSRPTVDVDILDGPRACKVCDGVLAWAPKGGSFGQGGWVHDGAAVEPHRAEALSQCRFCGGQGTLSHRQEAWFDASDCSRCGGVDGFAIGD